MELNPEIGYGYCRGSRQIRSNIVFGSEKISIHCFEECFTGALSLGSTHEVSTFISVKIRNKILGFEQAFVGSDFSIKFVAGKFAGIQSSQAQKQSNSDINLDALHLCCGPVCWTCSEKFALRAERQTAPSAKRVKRHTPDRPPPNVSEFDYLWVPISYEI